MLVNELMTTNVDYCSPEHTLNDVAYKMWQLDCGVVPVCNQEREVIGIITDRDICMRACFTDQPMSRLRVAEAMSENVRTSYFFDDVAVVEETMREAQLRRLPVVDESGHLAGIISLADLAREVASENQTARTDVTASQVGDTLSAVNEPRQGDGRRNGL